MTEVQERYGRLLEVLGFPSEDRAFDLHARSDWRHWSPPRMDVAREQLVYKWLGIEVGVVDGLAGPQTAYARESYAYWLENGSFPSWRDDPTSLPTPQVWPRESECRAFYGAPEAGMPLVKVKCPWTLFLAWDTGVAVSTISVHQKCAASLEEVLERQHSHYGHDGIHDLGCHLFGGAYAKRMKRGSRTSWSMHAYGCAIDFDPVRNGLNTPFTQSRLGQPDARVWWEIWESAGWVSLGRSCNFDPMHVQAARL